MAETLPDKLKKVVQTLVKIQEVLAAPTLQKAPSPLKTPERIQGKKQ